MPGAAAFLRDLRKSYPLSLATLRFTGEDSACRKRAGTLRWAKGREGCSDSPLPTSGLRPPRNGPRAARP